MSVLSHLPATLPILPLPGVILLPRARLPLNIFEPRYISMMDYTLGQPERLIGILQPSDSEKTEGMSQKLYSIGCAGRISSFHETEDKRYLITLTGLIRFEVTDFLEAQKPYRIVRPRWDDFGVDLEIVPEEDVDRKRLFNILRQYFKTKEISADWNSIQNTPNDVLISSLVMICPLAASEKQALLETPTLVSRADMLMTLLEMATFPQMETEGSVRH